MINFQLYLKILIWVVPDRVLPLFYIFLIPYSTDSKLHAKEVGSYRGRLLKRTIKRSKSVMGIFVSSKSSSSNFDTYKAKNIKQVKRVCKSDDMNIIFFKSNFTIYLSSKYISPG